MKQTQQDKILSMHEEGFTPRDMEEELGCSIGSIYATLAKFRLIPHQKHSPTAHTQSISKQTPFGAWSEQNKK